MTSLTPVSLLESMALSGFTYNISLSTEDLWMFPQLSFNYPQTTVGLTLSLLPGNAISVSSGRIIIDCNARFTLNLGAEILEDFVLEGLHANLTLATNDESAFQGNLDELWFADTKVMQPGSILKNPRDVFEMSRYFSEFKAEANQVLHSEFARVKSLFGVYFSDLDLNLEQGQIQVGVSLD
jgi:hypothetical protein